MYTFINYIKYDIMHILHLIRHTHIYTYTFHIFTTLSGLIMPILMTLFIIIRL